MCLGAEQKAHAVVRTPPTWCRTQAMVHPGKPMRFMAEHGAYAWLRRDEHCTGMVAIDQDRTAAALDRTRP